MKISSGRKSGFGSNASSGSENERRVLIDYSWLEDEPDHVRNVNREELERCLATAEALLKEEPALLEFSGKTIFVGDTHGDFSVTKEILKRFFEDKTQRIVFLGDYVDRAPEDVGTSIPNICYLLFAKCAYPDNVTLLKGNHEATYAIPCFPYEFEDEIESLYPGLHDRFLSVFAQMPLMVLANKIFAAHGGILKDYSLKQLRSVRKSDVHALEALTWSDPVISNTNRGAGYAFSSEELRDFLRGINAKIFVRAHDYTTLGMAFFDDACLTLFSSRRYRNMGNKGVLIARADEETTSLNELVLEDFSGNKWRRYKAKKI